LFTKRQQFPITLPFEPGDKLMPALTISLPAPLPAAATTAHPGRTQALPPVAVLPGFAIGSLVRTLCGDLPVEALEAGMPLIDSQGRLHSLRRRLALRPARTQMVRITPGALDMSARLDRDLLVGAAQKVLFDDWRIQLLHGGAAPVPARRLCDDMLITLETVRDTTLHVLVTDRQAVLRVNGLRMLSCDRALARALQNSHAR